MYAPLSRLHHRSSLIIYFSPHSLSSEQRFKQRFWEEGSICNAKHSRRQLQSGAHREPQPLPVQVSVFANTLTQACLWTCERRGGAGGHLS